MKPSNVGAVVKVIQLLRKNAGKKYTAKQVAKVLGISKVTAYKALKKAGADSETKQNNNSRGPKPDVFFF